MGHKVRIEPRRFEIGEVVEISGSLRSRFSGMCGEIVHVVQSRHAVTLDKYTVRLRCPIAAAETETFWDIELRKLERHLNTCPKENSRGL
jgi:hypothetical protein